MFDWHRPLPIPPGYRDAVVIDLESRSELDLTKVGLAKYCRNETTLITMVSWRWASQPPETARLWSMEQGGQPDELIAALQDPDVLLMAFNAGFERDMFKHVWKVDTPWSRWRDVMVVAYAHGFSGSLKKVCDQMEMPGHLAKDPEGDKLIHKFCKPRNIRHDLTAYWDWTSAPDDWARFQAYCVRDTDAEYRIAAALSEWPLPEWLWDEWARDMAMGERGVPVDREVILGAVAIAEDEIKSRLEDTRAITGIDNPNSRDQLLSWLTRRGVWMEDLRAETVQHALKMDLPRNIRRVLENRQMTARTNWKKFLSMSEAAVDGRIHNMIQFCGAGRTGRAAGRIVQLHNLARGTLQDPVTAADMVACGHHGLLAAAYETPVMDVLTSTVRCAITAGPGKLLTVADLKSIESCVLAWLSGCQTIIDLFLNGKDTYKAFATEYFQVSYDKVTKTQRTFSKPAVLGAGYQLGWRGLQGYAESMGVVMEAKEAMRMIKLFRRLYPEIPAFWGALREAAFLALNNPQCVFSAGEYLTFWYDGYSFLVLTLPSGRAIYYFQPEIRQSTIRYHELDENDKVVEKTIVVDALSYMGINQKSPSQAWERLEVSPGSTAENATQAVARDVLYHGLGEMTKEGIPAIAHVHDEGVAEVDADRAQESLALQIDCMTRRPPWADEKLFLGADGFITRRYRKD